MEQIRQLFAKMPCLSTEGESLPAIVARNCLMQPIAAIHFTYTFSPINEKQIVVQVKFQTLKFADDI